MLSVPGAPTGTMVDVFTEHVDIMPTLLDVSAGVELPACAPATTANLCTMGRSRAGLLNITQRELDALRASDPGAAFSQYQRPYAGPGGVNVVLNRSWCSPALGPCTIGYTMVAVHQDDGKEYRYVTVR